MNIYVMYDDDVYVKEQHVTLYFSIFVLQFHSVSTVNISKRTCWLGVY